MKTVFLIMNHQKVMACIEPATDMIAGICAKNPEFTEGMPPEAAMAYGLAMGMAMMIEEATQDGKEMAFTPVTAGTSH